MAKKEKKPGLVETLRQRYHGKSYWAKKAEEPSEVAEEAVEGQEEVAKEAIEGQEKATGKLTKEVAAGRKERAKEKKPGWLKRFSEKTKKHKDKAKAAAGMGVYIFLILLSFLGLWAKNYVSYQPSVSLLISIVMGVVFLFVVSKTPNPKIKGIFVIVAFAIDAFVTQGLLRYLPGLEVKNFFVAVHVFIWVSLAVCLFIVGLFEAFGSGKKVGIAGGIVTFILVGLAIFFLYPILIQNPYLYQDQTHTEYYQVAVEQLEKVEVVYEATKNVWSDYFNCVGRQTTRPGKETLDECLENKRIVRYCSKIHDKKDKRDECVRKKKEGIYVAGATAREIKELTTAKFETADKYFPSLVYRKAEEAVAKIKTEYPVTLKVENPRGLERVTAGIITAEIACEFTKGKKETIEGIATVGGQEGSTVSIKPGGNSIPVTCEPEKNLDGGYTLTYNATLRNLETTSYLTRAFIGEKSPAEAVRLAAIITADKFRSSSDALSHGPDEFARIDFAFGNTERDPIIGASDVIFASVIKTLGRGTIVKVNSYGFYRGKYSLTDGGFQGDCLQEEEVLVSGDSFEEVGLSNCFLELPDDLKNVEKYEIETFTATLNYDYMISMQKEIEVKVVS